MLGGIPTSHGVYVTIFEILFLVGVARDLAAGIEISHDAGLASHPFQAELKLLGAKVYEEQLTGEYGVLYEYTVCNFCNTDPMGLAMTYLLRYGSTRSNDGRAEEVHKELDHQGILLEMMIEVASLLDVSDPQAIGKLEAAIGLVSATWDGVIREQLTMMGLAHGPFAPAFAGPYFRRARKQHDLP